jgi:hypothetical protein
MNNNSQLNTYIKKIKSHNCFLEGIIRVSIIALVSIASFVFLSSFSAWLLRFTFSFCNLRVIS